MVSLSSGRAPLVFAMNRSRPGTVRMCGLEIGWCRLMRGSRHMFGASDRVWFLAHLLLPLRRHQQRGNAVNVNVIVI